MVKHSTQQIADVWAVASVGGAGVVNLTQIDAYVSIFAGLLASIAAGWSIYLHWKNWKAKRDEKKND